MENKKEKIASKSKKIKMAKKPASNYNLLQDGIKKNKLYSNRNNSSVSEKALNILYEEAGKIKKMSMQPGQLLVFDYKHPIHKEELEYYDASPCTIMFNVVNTPNGKRVLGFNLHYYPTKMRFVIMNAIFNMFKPFFIDNWWSGNSEALNKFDYKFIVNKLKRFDLDFGVRMYDPKLVQNLRQVPPKLFSTAVFTEGIFMKKTQVTIFKYWKDWGKKHSK